jgi:regulatory protein RepA
VKCLASFANELRAQYSSKNHATNASATSNSSKREAQPDRAQIYSDNDIIESFCRDLASLSLYEGDFSGYLSYSEAEQALCNGLAYLSGNRQQVERIWLSCPLGQREKTRRRDDYRARTIEKAFERPYYQEAARANAGTAWSDTPQSRSNMVNGPNWIEPPPISYHEFYSASAAPDAIATGLFYADVGVFIAPGGTGKTTLFLWIAVHIVLGRELWGIPILKPGPVLILTAEDSREMLVARLRIICTEMALTEDEIKMIAQDVRISDVSGSTIKLAEISREVVKPAYGLLDQIIAVGKVLKLRMIFVDPAISFGVGESRVNDNEQGLIEAGRYLRNALKCGVIFIHHTGKSNARDGTEDQYSGRGGSALADGSRMVGVIRRLTPTDWFKETGVELKAGESGLVLARPKMSYAPPQPRIHLRRTSYRFEKIEPISRSSEINLEANADKVWRHLLAEFAAGRRHSKSSLEDSDTGLTRNALRAALARLHSEGRTSERDMPDAGRGGRHKYLHPIDWPTNGGPIQETSKRDDAAHSLFGSPPPIGNIPPADQRRGGRCP